MNLHHARLLKLGLDRDPVTATQLLTSYASLPSPDSLTSALCLFAQVPSRSRDLVLWTALLSAFARSTRPAAALRLFSRLPSLCSNPFAFASAARAAASSAETNPRLARTLHAQAIQHGFQSNVVVSTSILGLYSKIGDLDSSCKMFDGMPRRNVITWNSMIAGYTSAGMGVQALDLFYRMRCIELELDVDEFTVASGLTACAALSDLRSGTQIHGFLITVGHETDPAVINALGNMYFRCGEVEYAERAMQGREESVESKLMMIKGYVFNERYHDAAKRILGRGGGFMALVMMDHSVIVSMLKVCANLGLLKTGRQVHSLLIALGLFKNCCSFDGNFILGSALIDMYCKCSSIREAQCVFGSMGEKHVSYWNSMITGCIYTGLINEAHHLFDAMPDKNVISWTAMISGYVQHGLPSEGLRLLARLYAEGGSIRGNCFTLAKALDACSCLAALHAGKEIHAQALRTMAGYGDDHVVIKTALIDMYSKSGNLNYARKIFDRMEIKNVVSWTSMITGYAVHGLGLQAIGVFEQMISMSFEPNEITFIAVLNACSHCGLVEQGINYFNLMTERYGIAPRADHNTCLVDMLGRAGKLAEAWKLVEEVKDTETNYGKNRGMESGEGASIWGALLGGCTLHGNVEIGSKVAGKMLEKKQQISDTYVGLSNVYAAAEMWDEVYKVREDWRKQGASREAGHSQIQIQALT